MKKNILITLILFITFSAFSQKKVPELNVYSFSDVEKIQIENPKPVLVFVHTDWCNICQAMKNITFKNKEVISLLNNNFYFIYLNAEQQKDINFLNKKFTYKPTGHKTGTHQLAKELATINGKISYPTSVILNSKFEIDLQIDSYLSSKVLEQILKKYLRL